MAKIRNIIKSRAGMEDLLQGVGPVSQDRGKSTYDIHKVDVPFAVSSEAEMQALDVTVWSRARVYSGTIEFLDYIYDPLAATGIPPLAGTGFWVVLAKGKIDTQDTYADVRALTASYPFEAIIVGGANVVGVGGGTFYYDSGDVSSADNGGTILVDAAGRRWKRLGFDGLYKAEYFGLSVAASGAENLSALTLAPDGSTLNPGSYLISGGVLGKTFYCDGLAEFVGGNITVINTRDAKRTMPDGKRWNVGQLATGINYNKFPNKFIPTVWWMELLRLSPNVTEFERTSDSLPRQMTEGYIREVIGDAKDAGVTAIILPYVEYLGFWFYRDAPNYYDYDTSRLGKFWKEWLSGDSGVEDFDAVSVILEECNRLGLDVFIGLGRGGDSEIVNDLAQFWDGTTGNPSGGPDPLRHGLTLTQRNTSAIDRMRDVASDIVSKFASIPSFAGFYISHEPDSVEFSGQLIGTATGIDGVNPKIKSYGLDIIVSPPTPIDISSPSFSTNLYNLGCSVVCPQDAVGAGNNIATGFNQFVPSKTISQLPEHYKLWRAQIDKANNYAIGQDQSIQFWFNVEVWQMGVVGSADLTLSSVGGASVTVTASAPAFTVDNVGAFLTGEDTGRAKIISFVSPTIVTVDTTYTGESFIADGGDFSGTSRLAGTWAISKGYQNDYPAAFSRIEQQIEIASRYCDRISVYAGLGFFDTGANSLRVAQTNSDIIDYRSKAISLFSGVANKSAIDSRRYRNSAVTSVVRKTALTSGSVTGAAITTLLGEIYPQSKSSRFIISLNVYGFSNTGVDTYTFDLTINGVSQVSQSTPTNGYIGGSGTLVFVYEAGGQPFDVGYKVTSGGVVYNVSSVIVIIEELI